MEQAIDKTELKVKCSALGNSVRIHIMEVLSDKPCTSWEIIEKTKLTESKLYYHLSKLVTAGLICLSKQEGQGRYCISREGMISLIKDLLLFDRG